MRRKIFKVMTRYDTGIGLEFATLTEVLGYFKTLSNEPVFVYFNDKDNLWYVIDLDSGLAVCNGETMKLAEESFTVSWKLDYYHKYKDTKSYKNAIKKYKELLGGALNEVNIS